MSPRIHPRPGARYRVTVTEVGGDGTETTWDHTGTAYIVAVANITGTRIVGDVDHDGDATLRERLVGYIANTVFDTLHGPPRSER